MVICLIEITNLTFKNLTNVHCCNTNSYSTGRNAAAASDAQAQHACGGRVPVPVVPRLSGGGGGEDVPTAA